MIELMVVVAIAAILMSIAVPGLQGLMATQRVKTVAYELVADLTLARSEALKRGREVSFVPATVGGWLQGWSVTTTSVAAGVTTDVALWTKPPVGSGVIFSTVPGTITFDATGRLAGAAGVVRFGINDGASYKRCISLDPSGRPKVATTDCPA